MITDISRTKEPYFEGVRVCHACYTLRFILHGNGHMTVEDETVLLSPGTIVCTPPYMEQQGFSNEGIDEVVIYLTQFHLGQNEGPRVLVLQDDVCHSAMHLFSLLNNIFQQRNIFLDPLLKSVYNNLYQFIETQYMQSTFDARIVDITRQLHETYMQTDLSVEWVLATQGQNTDYLRRLFKKNHGCTPVQYLNALRLGQAKKMLEANCLHHLSITQIAEQSGFSDASYFARVFRDYIGLSPSQYELLFPGAVPFQKK